MAELGWEFSLGAGRKAARDFERQKDDLLVLAVAADDEGTVREWLSVVGETPLAVSGFFAVCRDLRYSLIRAFLDAGISPNASMRTDLNNGFASISVFAYYASLCDPDHADEYFEVFGRMLDHGASGHSGGGGFYYDAPGWAGNYVNFSFSVFDIAEDRIERGVDDGERMLRLLRAHEEAL
ncbi:MAG: hypothetical protein IKQ92_08970 [Clostridia bacterium]|nr:hypothetical protein [Clostridia bacterium]